MSRPYRVYLHKTGTAIGNYYLFDDMTGDYMLITLDVALDIFKTEDFVLHRVKELPQGTIALQAKMKGETSFPVTMSPLKPFQGTENLKISQTFYQLPNSPPMLPNQYLGYCQKDHRWETYDYNQVMKFDYTIRPIEKLPQSFLLDMSSFPPCSC